jgi:hypothetical protein
MADVDTQQKLERAAKLAGIVKGGAVALEALDYRIKGLRRDAMQQAEYLTRRLHETMMQLASGATALSSCGVLQGNSVTFDACMVQLSALESLRASLTAGLRDAAFLTVSDSGAHTLGEAEAAAKLVAEGLEIEADPAFQRSLRYAEKTAKEGLKKAPPWWPQGHYEVLTALTLWGAGKVRDTNDLEAIIEKAAALVKGGA